ASRLPASLPPVTCFCAFSVPEQLGALVTPDAVEVWVFARRTNKLAGYPTSFLFDPCSRDNPQIHHATGGGKSTGDNRRCGSSMLSPPTEVLGWGTKATKNNKGQQPDLPRHLFISQSTPQVRRAEG